MSIDYNLQFEDNLLPEALLAKVKEICGFPEVRNNVLQDAGTRFTVSAYKVTDEWVIEESKKENGFPISSYLSMRHGKIQQERCEELMMLAVVELLQVYSCNVVLVFCESPSVVLFRRDNSIFIKSDWMEMAGIGLFDEANLQYSVID